MSTMKSSGVAEKTKNRAIMAVSFMLLLSSPAFASNDETINEVTCYIDGVLTQLFFDGGNDAEGELNTSELVVAKSIEWSDADMPKLSTLDNIAMKIEFPFRLEGEGLDCEVYHPSRWWFNNPKLWEAFEEIARQKDAG